MTNLPNKVSLPQALKAHAAALQPEFSPLLHHRIMATLRQEARMGGAAPLAAAPLRFHRHWPAAIAATIALPGALGVFFILSAAHSPASKQIAIIPTPGPVQSVPSLPPLQALLQTAIAPASATLEDGKYAYLDHDARRFAGFVLSQVPGSQQ